MFRRKKTAAKEYTHPVTPAKGIDASDVDGIVEPTLGATDKAKLYAIPYVQMHDEDGEKYEWYRLWTVDGKTMTKPVPNSEAMVRATDYGQATDDFINWWNAQNGGRGRMQMTIGYPVVQGRIVNERERRAIKRIVSSQ